MKKNTLLTLFLLTALIFCGGTGNRLCAQDFTFDHDSFVNGANCNPFINYPTDFTYAWKVSHGTPILNDLYGQNTYTMATLEANYDLKTSSQTGEGLYINYNFVKTHAYTITISLRARTNLTGIRIALANGLPTSANTACGQDAVPANIDKLEIYNQSQVPGPLTGGGFTTVTVYSSQLPNKNYSQLWVYSSMDYPGSAGSFDILDVNISDKCPGFSGVTLSPGGSVCFSGPKTLTASTPGYTSAYLWSPATGLNATNTASVVATPAATTTYTVKASVNGCTDSKSVTLVPTPGVSAGPNQVIYADTPPFSLAYSSSPSGGAWSGPGITPAGLFTPASAGGNGVKTLTYSYNNGTCTVTSTKTITINPLATNTTSVKFDGSTGGSSIIDVPYNLSQDLNSGNFTIEAWIALDPASGTNPTILSNTDTDAGNGLVFYITNNNQLALRIRSAVSTITTLSNTFPAINTNVCHHVAVTRANGQVTFYLDGISQGGGTNSISPSTNNDYWIGGADFGGVYGYFKGTMDEVRLWNIAIDQPTLNANKTVHIAGNANGLIGYWDFNDGGYIVHDVSVSAVNGVLNNYAYLPGLASFPARTAINCYTPSPNAGLIFDGSNKLASIPSILSYNFDNGATFEAIIKLNSNSGLKPGIISNTNTDNDMGFVFYVNNGTQLALRLRNIIVTSSTFPSIYDGNCHYVAFTRSAAGIITFYLDGVAKGGATNTSTLYNDVLEIGTADSYDNFAFTGTINEIRFWNTVRPISTYQLIANPSAYPSLIGYFQLNESSGQVINDYSIVGNSGYLGQNSSVEAIDAVRTSVTCNGYRVGIDGSSTLEANATDDITVYPNPFDEGFSFVLTGGSDTTYTVQAYNLLGQLVYSGNISNETPGKIGAGWAKGMYTLKVIDANNKTTIHKVVKQ